jgi:Leucine-rich repeat (LRR) protein
MLKVILIAALLVAAEALCPEGCSCNPQTHIKCTNVLLDRVLENMNENAQHIIISFSNISSLSTTPLKKFKKLTNITLNYSSIKSVGPSVFSFTNNLTYLDMSSNNIESLHGGALTRLNSLRTLILRHNKISSIHPQLFFHNTKLIFLDLSHNFIESIHTKIFDENVHLCWVNLEGNPLLLPSDWDLLFKASLNTLEVSLNDTNWIMVSLSNIPSLKTLTDDTLEGVTVTRTASNLEVRMNMENISSYENVSFLSTSERITLHNNLLNKMSRMWNSKSASLFYNRDGKVVTGNMFTGDPLFAYCVRLSVWFWFSGRMTKYVQSTASWKSCQILYFNTVSNSAQPTTLQSKTQTLTLSTTDMPATSTATSTTADVAENSQPYITGHSSLEEDERSFSNIILYISIPVCVIIIVVIITVIIIKKAKRSREELGSSSADHYFFFYNALPRSQTRETSKQRSIIGNKYF